MNRHARRALESTLRRGNKLVYPDHLGCPVCGKAFIAPSQHHADVNWKGGIILVPLDLVCVERWNATPASALSAAMPRLTAWIEAGRLSMIPKPKVR